ncbi:MAG: tRNA (adenosine(37)-N6)-dimethylallyltransferase MiaA [Saprospiraceae bacterium]|nr:tRNA (adenosine(37)-N6)-dimethylallyltransferase MiaA [Saprospiraceae bacterium]
MDKSKKLIVIGGPTASGKTELAVRLAKNLNTAVFSADSRQVYHELNIGVARPTAEEMQGIVHHFIDHVSIIEDYSVGRYEAEVMTALDLHYKHHDSAILVGGTGLYLRAITHGIDPFPDIPAEINEQLENELLEHGLHRLVEELSMADPLSHAALDLQNSRRVIRALSIIRTTGHPFSHFKTGSRQQRPFEIEYHYLEPERSRLYQKIDSRVDLMMTKGLLAEVEGLLKYRPLKALDTVGYRELFDYFDGLLSLEEAVDKIKQHSRNYAKRQMTWFRKYNEEMKSLAVATYF